MSKSGEVRDAPWEGLEALQLVGGSAYGGAVPVIFAIMDVTAALGMRPVLLASHPDVVAAALAEGREVWDFPGIDRDPRPLHDLVVALRLAGALRRRGVRIVHTHTSKGGMVGRLAARLAGCDLVIHHTHSFYHTGLGPGARRRSMRAFERFFARLDDRQIFINSGEMRDATASGLVPSGRAALVPNGIDDPRDPAATASSLRGSWGVPSGAEVIGTVCRIDIETKGLDTGLAAFAELAAVRPATHWVIAGKGEDEAMFRSLVAAAGLGDRVHLLGHVPRAGALHIAFDLTFAPSRREGQSVTIMEAMACGTPVVATRIPGNLDLVLDGVNGSLASVDHAATMAAALGALLEDPEVRARMGAAGRRMYEREYTRTAFEERMREFYAEALRGAFGS